MKKLINDNQKIVEEVVKGIVSTNPDLVTSLENIPVVVRKNKSDKVGLVSGGGSGHEPAHAGFVGEGMLDAAVLGEIFTSPSADKVYEAIKAADNGKGVLLIIKNYSGDVMNFEMAAEMAAMEGIKVDKVIVDDDIAVENSTYTVGRRGIAGTILVHKILGAAAENGSSLEDLVALGNKIIPNIKTMGMAIKPCTLLSTGKVSFDISDDEVEIGLGIHGEPGTHREKINSANYFVDMLVEKILKEQNINGEEVAILVNGLGETTLIELYIIANRLTEILKEKNIKVVDSMVGNYMTSLDMGGFSITIAKLDEESKKLLKQKANTIALKRF